MGKNTQYMVSGRVYLLLEYMFFGSGMIDWDNPSLDDLFIDDNWADKSPFERYTILNNDKLLLNFSRHNYIYGLLKVIVNDYVNVGSSYLFSADDQSAIFSSFINIDPFQSFTICINFLFPMDWNMINSDWNVGEFGTTNLGYHQSWKITCKVKF